MMRKYKNEFHVHTIFSKDSMLTYPFLLLMLKLKKINCVAITDHNEIKGALKYKKRLSKHNIQVIVGEEIFTSDGEIIGLFLSKKIEPGLSAEETIKQIRKQDGIVYVPHPYDLKRIKTVLKPEVLEKVYKSVDFIEVHNGRNIKCEYSEMQKAIQKKYKINPIIGSDSHTFFEIGRNYILTNEPINHDNILLQIDKGEFVKNNCIKFAHTATKFVKLLKMIFRGDIDGIFRIIKKRCRKNK